MSWWRIVHSSTCHAQFTEKSFYSFKSWAWFSRVFLKSLFTTIPCELSLVLYLQEIEIFLWQTVNFNQNTSSFSSFYFFICMVLISSSMHCSRFRSKYFHSLKLEDIMGERGEFHLQCLIAFDSDGLHQPIQTRFTTLPHIILNFGENMDFLWWNGENSASPLARSLFNSFYLIQLSTLHISQLQTLKIYQQCRKCELFVVDTVNFAQNGSIHSQLICILLNDSSKLSS